MMDRITLLYFCGIYNVLFVVFHILFWKIFKWNTSLDKGTKSNKAVIQLLNVMLIFIFGFMAFVYFSYPNELFNSPLGKALLIGFFLFWFLRFIIQFVFVKIRGSFVISLTIVFLLGVIIHLLPLLS